MARIFPTLPKFSSVSMMPIPNSSSQYRFTATRAVSGWPGEKNHFASVRRSRGIPRGGSEKSLARPGGVGPDLVKKVAALEF